MMHCQIFIPKKKSSRLDKAPDLLDTLPDLLVSLQGKLRGVVFLRKKNDVQVVRGREICKQQS